MLKKIFISLCVLFLLSANTVSASPDSFVLPAITQEAVEYLNQKEVIGNQEAFRVDELIGRADFLMLILKNAGYDPAGLKRKIFPTPFQDVDLSSKYAPYLYEALEKGLIESAERFYPQRAVTRIEALKMFFAVEGIPSSYYQSNLRAYADVPLDSAIAPIVGTALDLELILPVDRDHFGVMQRITKGEVAQMLYVYDFYHAQVGLKSTSPYLEVEDIPRMEIFLDVWRQIHANYLHADEIDDEEIVYGAIEGMVDALGDEYSLFMPPAQSADFNDSLEGEIEGIGAYIDYQDGKVLIVAPIQNSPAEKAGLKPNDEVIKIDGAEILDLTLLEIVDKIKGPKGTEVQMTILRDGREMLFTIVRDQVRINSVELKMQDQIAIVSISQFVSKTKSEFQEVLTELKEQNAQGMILDLRNDPGGYLNTAIEILGYFVDSGTRILTLDYPEISFPQKANGTGELKDFPLVVLINEGSASASEIVAGALQDLDLAELVGETSYGKGTVQEVLFYQGGSNLKLTVAKWLTASGRWINNTGLEPDYVVEDKEDTETDEQMEKAFEIINDKI